jgi:hypothetical protein
MSCIRFNTPAQKRQLSENAPAMQLGTEPVAQFLSPTVTDSKRERIRRLAASPDPRIRESAALSYHAPDDVYELLARDPEASVRSCLARNERTPCDVLRTLAADPDEQVRAWVAINYFVPADAMQRLAADTSDTVRALVSWKASLANQAETVAASA